MPFLGIGFHVLIALYFAVHAIRTGQNLFWLMILFAFPLLGSIVYLFAIYLPELRGSAGAQRARRAIRSAVAPGQALREARGAFEQTPTVAARLRLADALYANGELAAALEHYREAAQGPFASDAAILFGLARALLASGEAAEAKTTLDKLFEVDPSQRANASLLYARALAETSAPDAETRAAFEAALGPAKDAEARCRYADWLAAREDAADREKAQALYREIIKDSAFWHRHAHAINREWLARAKAATR